MPATIVTASRAPRSLVRIPRMRFMMSPHGLVGVSRGRAAFHLFLRVTPPLRSLSVASQREGRGGPTAARPPVEPTHMSVIGGPTARSCVVPHQEYVYGAYRMPVLFDADRCS